MRDHKHVGVWVMVVRSLHGWEYMVAMLVSMRYELKLSTRKPAALLGPQRRSQRETCFAYGTKSKLRVLLPKLKKVREP